jgi:uncharacterized protein YkwD/uncharacterized membrane protein required for colicin V production
MNSVDLLIIVALITYLVMGYSQGFIKIFLEVLGFVFALAVAFAFYPFFSNKFAQISGYPLSISNVFGFFAIWILVDAIYLIGASFIYNRFSKKIIKSSFNKAGGLVASFLKAVIIIAVFLTLTISLPVSGTIKAQILDSRISAPLINKTSALEKDIQKAFGSVLKDSLTFFTVRPDVDEKIELGYKQAQVTVDEKAEKELLDLLNKERLKVGLNPLVMDVKLRDLAREHSRDMFFKGYFAHQNLEGLSPFDRMDLAGIVYGFAGENLALAPSVDLAHTGLMNSPGHRANILDPNFKKIGIGCVDGGRYGKMFSQEFTD